MTVKILTENHLEFISLKGGYTGSSESTLVKMPHCWNSQVGLIMPPTLKKIKGHIALGLSIHPSVREAVRYKF